MLTDFDYPLIEGLPDVWTFWVDGGCAPNPGKGGWAVVAVEEKTGIVVESSGYIPNTSNNRMELYAAIKALETAEARKADKVIIVTDSNYLKSGITQWIVLWKFNGWKASTGHSVKNADLWKILDEHNSRIPNVEWRWTKAHVGNKYNERADELVRKARDEHPSG